MNMSLKGMMKSLNVKPGQVVSDPYARAFAAPLKEAEGQDHEVSMAKGSLESIVKHATELMGKLGNEEKDIPGWIQDHIAKSENFIQQANDQYHEYGTNESINEAEVGINVAYIYKKVNGDKNKFFSYLSQKKKELKDEYEGMVDYMLDYYKESPKKFKSLKDKEEKLFNIVSHKTESVNEAVKDFTPEKRRALKPGEIEVMKGYGDIQKWFYVKSEDDAKTLVRLGRMHYMPTGITKNNSKVKFDKGWMVDESVNEADSDTYVVYIMDGIGKKKVKETTDRNSAIRMVNKLMTSPKIEGAGWMSASAWQKEPFRVS